MRYSPRNDAVPLSQKVVLTVADVCALSGFGMTKIYEAMNAGKLIARKEGVRTVILRSDFDEWIKSLPKRQRNRMKGDRHG